MLIVLDAGAIINDEGFDFIEGHQYVITPLVDKELRDSRSKNLAENALRHGQLKIVEPLPRYLTIVKNNIEKIGMRLSQADISVLALAEQLRHQKPLVVSDDYSVQNYCKHYDISFSGAIMGEIEQAKTFRRKPLE
jgi:rRNA maturation endonuclease Nob1